VMHFTRQYFVPASHLEPQVKSQKFYSALAVV